MPDCKNCKREECDCPLCDAGIYDVKTTETSSDDANDYQEQVYHDYITR